MTFTRARPVLLCVALLLDGGAPGAAPVEITLDAAGHAFRGGPRGDGRVVIDQGDTVVFKGLGTADAIVRTDDPRGRAPCSSFAPYREHDRNEFTGPMRKGASGIIAVGHRINRDSDGDLHVKARTEETVAGAGLDPSYTCAGGRVALSAARDGATGAWHYLCRGGREPVLMDLFWDEPEIDGVTLRFNWWELQDGPDSYTWDALDRAMDRAARTGKTVNINVRAGKHGTPHWIFTEGAVAEIVLKSQYSGGDCADEDLMSLGNPGDPNYRALFQGMVRALVAHLKERTGHYQAVTRIGLGGVNKFSWENSLPRLCRSHDQNDPENRYQCYTAGHPRYDPAGCCCNTEVWAKNGYSPAGLYAYYGQLAQVIGQSTGYRKSLEYTVISGGYPAVVSDSAYWRGDGGRKPIGWGTQTDTVLRQGREGSHGRLFGVMNKALGHFDGRVTCPGGTAPVDPHSGRAEFPLPNVLDTVGPDLNGPGCPNGDTVREGMLGQVTGFQVIKSAQGQDIDSAENVDRTLWQLTRRSNAVYLEVWADDLWQIIYERQHSGRAEPLPLVADQAHPKTLGAWGDELHDRRRRMQGLYDPADPHLDDPHPPQYEHRFDEDITSNQTYWFVSPRSCGQRPGGFYGSITVIDTDDGTSLASAEARLVGEATGDRASVVDSAGDVNGDGFEDLIVGAPSHLGTGAAYLVLGPVREDRNLDAADARFFGEAAGDRAGASVAGGGDVNGDGFDDLVIGAPGGHRSYLVLGGPGLAGDRSLGDGRHGIVRLSVHGQAPGGVGLSVSLGDIDGDGIADIALGAPRAGPAEHGAVYVLNGPIAGDTVDLDLATWARAFRGASAGDRFGSVVAFVGDVYGRGADALAVGAPAAARGGADTGVVELISQEAGPLWGLAVGGSLLGGQAGDLAGASVVGVGDIDGDGYSDILVGAPGTDRGNRTDAGAAYLVYGPVIGTTGLPEAGVPLVGEADGGGAGWRVAAGDLTGDGMTDLIVGAPQARRSGSRSGAAYVVSGAKAMAAGHVDLGDDAAWRLFGEKPADLAGQWLAVGDVDGDRHLDLLVGAPDSDANGTDAGQVYTMWGPI